MRALFVFLAFLIFVPYSIAASDAVLITSDTKTLTVLKDGIRTGGGGEEVSISPGPNAFTIKSPGLVSRQIMIWRLDRPIRSFRVNMAAPIKVSPLPKIPSFSGSPLRIKSVCAHHRLKETCHRKTWMDDLFFSGFLWVDPKDPTKFQPRESEFMKAHPVTRRYKVHPLFYLGYAEAISARYPLSPEAQNFVARESLFKSRCDRIRQLILGSYQVGADSPHLWLSLGLCFEALGKGREAEGFYEVIPQKHAAPDTAYHHARLLLEKNPIKGYKIAKECVKKWPGYYPCYQLAEQLMLVQGRSVKGFEKIYRKKNLVSIKKIVTEADTLNRSDPGAAQAYLEEASREYRINFEIMAQMILHAGRASAELEYRIASSHFTSLAIVLSQLNEIKKLNDHDFYLKILRRATQEFPTSRHFWSQLVSYYEEQKNCKEVVKTIGTVEIAIDPIPKNFLQRKGNCLLKTKKFKAAIHTYKMITKMDPKNWKSFYNLGVAYDAAGKRSSARKSFQKALDLNPPDSDATRIKERVSFKKKRRGQSKEDKEGSN